MMDISFEELFNKSCDFIGYTESDFLQTLGEPDSVEMPGEKYKYFIYDEIDVAFRLSISRGIIDSVVTPFNADPNKIREGYYRVLGAEIGDTVERVCQMWGNPSEIDVNVLVYNTTPGVTSRGVNFEVRLTFKNNLLEDFTALLYIPQKAIPKSGCFISTACYGHYDAEEVLVLRKYRDDVLLKKKSGAIAVKIYYFFSPPLSRLIEKSNSSKIFVRKYILGPMISKIQASKHKNITI